MMMHASEITTWLLQATALHDTIYTRQIAAEPTIFEKVTSVASGLLTLAMLALAIGLVPAAWSFRKSYQKLSKILERTQGQVQPILTHATAIADNVEFVTTSVRADVQRLHATVAMANARLQRAIEEAEARVQDFNALIGVVQDEAEGVFVSAASTVRGVRAGAAALHEDDGPEFASELDDPELDEPETGSLELAAEDEAHGDDSDFDEEQAVRPGPRIRPRPRRG